jgi:DNA-directed RNA polymerase subunit M/transcription elongation factor TFIIS
MDMQFCQVCDNLLYLYENEESKQLYLGCKTCGNQQENHQNYIYDDQMSIDLSETISQNKHLKEDITLPTIKDNPNIKCPNVDCDSHKQKTSNILYLKYDKQNMKYMYLCKDCQQTWTNK